TPPLFAYEALSYNKPNDLAVIYDSPRRVCAVLWGCIEGAAERYGERVSIVERSCVQRGAAVCRFELHFFRAPAHSLVPEETTAQQEHQRASRQLDDLVLSILPSANGVTLSDLQAMLRRWAVSPSQVRPSV